MTVFSLCVSLPKSPSYRPLSPPVRPHPSGLIVTELHLKDLISKHKSWGSGLEHVNLGRHNSAYGNVPLPSKSGIFHRCATDTLKHTVPTT